MGKRFLISIAAAALGAAVMATGASADFRSVGDPRGDTGCDHGPCSASDKRKADIVRATAGHEDGKLRHTIRVVGKVQNGWLFINTDSDQSCEWILRIERGHGHKVQKCDVSSVSTGRARMDFHRHSVKIVFSERSIGNPQSYGWRATAFGGTSPGYAYDGVPNRRHYIRHRLAQPAAAAVQQLSCGDTITADTTLHKNLVNCPNDGIVIGADGITLDLNGHTIDGDAPAAGTGVVNDGHDGVTVRHGSIRQFADGVQFTEVRHNRLLGISASRIEAVGIHIFDSSRILVRNCSGNRTASHDTEGVLVISSHHFRILNSSFRHNDHNGISVFDSRNGVIKGNVVSDSGDDGVFMKGGEGVRITHNRVVRNHGGITLWPGSHNVIKRNRVRRARDGFLVRGDQHGLLLKGNIARRASDDGFDVNDRGTKLTKNRAVRNGDLGIEAVGGVNDGGGNVARHNGDPRQCTHVACR